MEGVVLYVTLVKVFIKYPTRYIAAFTIISYGIIKIIPDNNNNCHDSHYRCTSCVHDDSCANWVFD